jgi:hypothetical protein
MRSAEHLGQIAPQAAGPADPENRFDEPAIVSCRLP